MEKAKTQPKLRSILSDINVSQVESNANIKTRKRKRSDSKSNTNDPQKIPKQTAAASSISISKCNTVCMTDECTKVEAEISRSLKEEVAAVFLTGKEDCPRDRRLTAFTVHDKDGKLQPIDMVGEAILYISALILPLEDIQDDEKETRIRCEGFGPIDSWSMSGYDDNSPIIWLTTKAGDYECLKPAKVYEKQYDLFFQKICACIYVYRTISKCYGGNPNIGLSDLVTEASHLWTEKSNDGSKELIISWGRFIHDQLVGLDDESLEGDTIFTNLPVLLALRDASDKGVDLVSMRGRLRRKLQQHPVSSEYNISDDYPPPTCYEKSIKEVDECTIFNGESGDDDPDSDSDELPQHFLDNWCLYSFDGRFIPLELLPVKSSAGKDQKICCSGVMTADHDCSPLNSYQDSDGGIAVQLSEIKEWNIKWVSSEISISFRTDIAWYTLRNPLALYNPWYEPVVKIVALAVSIIKLLKEQRRASRLSFREVVEKVSDFSGDDPSYVSSDSAAVERYILVHGQFILQLFESYPDLTIRKCAFVRSLGDNLKELNHSKTVKKKVFQRKEENPPQEGSVEQHEVSETKAMRATTTKLVRRIWDEYMSAESEELEDKTFSFGTNIPRGRKSSNVSTIVRWDGKQVGRSSLGQVFYKKAMVGRVAVHAGSSVVVEKNDSKKELAIVFLEYLFEESGGEKKAHGRLMLRGHQTVLGYSINKRELFLTNHCLEFELSSVRGVATVEIRESHWGHHHRKTNASADTNDRAKAEERRNQGLPLEFFCKKLYCFERGAFLCLKPDSMGIGNGYCQSCKLRESHDTSLFKLSRSHFQFEEIKYHINDFIYVDPHYDASDEINQKNPKSKRNPELKPFIICQILGIEVDKPLKSADHESTMLRLQRFFRPEDISKDKAYHSDIREIYYSEQVIKMPVVAVQGKCELRKKEEMHHFPTTYVYQHIFYCEQLYDHQTGALKKLSPQVRRGLSSRELVVKASVKSKKSGKQKKKKKKERMLDDISNQEHSANKRVLNTLDIFAGCGGLSSGLERSGVSKTKWAIEYEQPTGEAFKLNHPEARMFIRNCNVILRAIMTACGDADDCDSTSEATDLAARLGQKEINDFPRPGEVDFIIGGPPCQGFSKMNRYNEGSWSQVQCEMILPFLSFADYFRPKYFLLENVRNFISFKKGQVFRFTLAALLEMGYQVRFGVLEAGAYGVSQNRKRAFIWAASPEENLPEWPEPMYVFKGLEIKIPLGGNIHYAATRSTQFGAPFRPITVRDTIGDLPPVKNGAVKPKLEYKKDPISWFQRQIRGEMQHLDDHISKQMNEINLQRCRRIPKRPGADWHDLPNKKVRLTNGKMADLLPPWMPKTAGRNNQWKGLYGRLDWSGKFPTCITDPQPMGKVGRWFHPQQDRIVTVREYARAQGFPDSYRFAGNIHHKHRQVGNAVPPPLAFALGKKLKEAIEKKCSDSP